MSRFFQGTAAGLAFLTTAAALAATASAQDDDASLLAKGYIVHTSGKPEGDVRVILSEADISEARNAYGPDLKNSLAATVQISGDSKPIVLTGDLRQALIVVAKILAGITYKNSDRTISFGAQDKNQGSYRFDMKCGFTSLQQQLYCYGANYHLVFNAPGPK